MKNGNQDLIRRARNGDMDAFAEAFEPLRPTVYAVAMRLVGPHDAEDVAMDTFLKAWQAIPRFRGQSSLKTWLYRIARNRALDHIRKRKRRREVSVTGPEDEERDVMDGIADPSQRGADREAVSHESESMIAAALARLPELHRTTLELRFADGLSYNEIAAATGVSIGTVMSRLFNAKKKLKRILKNEDVL